MSYHGIISQDSDSALEQYCVTEEVFRQHLRFYRRRLEPVPVSTIVARVREGRPLPPKWIAVTLDDALLSQATLAAEMLASERLPWALAVPAGLVEAKRTVWTYELRFLLRHAWQASTIPHPLDPTISLPTGRLRDRVDAAAALVPLLLQSATRAQRSAYVDRLIDEVGRQNFVQQLQEDRRFVLADWKLLRQLSQSGVEILSHGYFHDPHNATLSVDEMRWELAASRQLLSERVGVQAKGFAFPNGTTIPESAELLELAGYEFGLTSNLGRIECACTPWLLPRINAEYPLSTLRDHLRASSR